MKLVSRTFILICLSLSFSCVKESKRSPVKKISKQKSSNEKYRFSASGSVKNVKDFGALGVDWKPDGTRGNDTLAIKTAIRSMTEAGGTLYFPPGMYNVHETLNLPSNVMIQGHTSFDEPNCQIRLMTRGIPLFSILEGKSNIALKDIVLVSRVNEAWPRQSPDQTLLIRNENTTGLSLVATDEIGISDIEIENVRIINFTYGISATTGRFGYDALIQNVKIRNLASDTNEYALFTNTRGAKDWDVQNLNVYPMFNGQNGIFLEKSGKMAFLQLSCAGPATRGNRGNICAKLWGNGETYFKNMHVEGPRLGICVGSDCDGAVGNKGENPNVIIIENSATDGQFHRATNLISTANRFWLDYMGNARYKFYNSGVNSQVYSCGDVYISFPSHQEATTPDLTGKFTGLTVPHYGCHNHYLSYNYDFSTGYYVDDVRLPEEMNVKTMGAGNQNADQDTQILQLAINKASKGGRIFIPAGNYFINAPLILKGGEVLIGEPGTHLTLQGPGKSMFLVNATDRVVKGIVLRGLHLSASEITATTAIDLRGAGGAATDFQFHDLIIESFDIGIRILSTDGTLGSQQPMFDSIAVKNLRLIGNNTGALLMSQNASNWNVEDTFIENMTEGQTGIIVNGIGLLALRNISCNGNGSAKACLIIQRQNALLIENLQATGVLNAIEVPWENGWTQFPVMIRKSDLTAGLKLEGKIFLTSLDNKFQKFGVRLSEFQQGPEGSNNNAPGVLSQITSCRDTFIDSATGDATSNWSFIGDLRTPVKKCL